MLQSANDAAVALADAEAGSVAAFVQQMNRRATQLGMHDTHFDSPNGLNDNGYSTATDLATLTKAAMANPKFAKIVHTKEYTLPGPEKGDTRQVQNRNVLLWLYPGATGVKTGYTNLARYCVVATADRGGRNLAAIVLGSPGEEFSDAAELLNYGFTQFDSQTVIEQGKDFGERIVGDSRVNIAAGADLTTLVPSGEHSRITAHAVVDGGVATVNIVKGSRVGYVVATLGGETLGRVPLVATAVAPLEAPAGTWWSRTLTTIGRAFTQAVNGVFT
jgi:D-alanyl-D-alanine carboxypeptidase (penicillin-binding protein 5/6)